MSDQEKSTRTLSKRVERVKRDVLKLFGELISLTDAYNKTRSFVELFQSEPWNEFMDIVKATSDVILDKTNRMRVLATDEDMANYNKMVGKQHVFYEITQLIKKMTWVNSEVTSLFEEEPELKDD